MCSMANKLCIILTSLDDSAKAKELAHRMIESGLAACVQISGPGTSIYRWQGKIESAEEFYLAIKTTSERLDNAMAWLRQHHPYDVPELVWWPIHADGPYIAWVNDMIDSAGQ